MKFEDQKGKLLYEPDFCNDWKRRSLYDLAKWKNGLAFKNINFSDVGKPVIKIAELKNGLTDQTKYTSDTFKDSVALKKGDMLFSWSGNPKTSIDVFWYNLTDGWLNQHIFKVVELPIIRKWFLYYILKYLQPNFEGIAANKQTTGLGHVTVADLKRITVSVPPLSEQKAIADTLSCLDDKIELNNRMNRTLEEMAQAIFKSWFVDFEPFQDGEFVDSELGPIPKGWRVGTLGEIAEISTKSINPSKTPETLFEHYSIPAYDEANFPVFEKGNNIKSNKYLIPCDAWLISKLNPTTKRVWQPFMLSKNAICSTEFIVYSASKLRYRDFCFESTNSANFFDFLCSNTSGSTNSRQRAIPKETLKYQLVIPTENIVKGFSQLVDPIYARMKNNLVECRRLISLRDSLLPKLMSGEIRVPMEAK